MSVNSKKDVLVCPNVWYTFEKNLKTEIRGHSLSHPKVSVKDQSDSLYIFVRARSTLQKVLRDFHPHFKIFGGARIRFLGKIRKTASEK